MRYRLSKLGISGADEQDDGPGKDDKETPDQGRAGVVTSTPAPAASTAPATSPTAPAAAPVRDPAA